MGLKKTDPDWLGLTAMGAFIPRAAVKPIEIEAPHDAPILQHVTVTLTDGGRMDWPAATVDMQVGDEMELNISARVMHVTRVDGSVDTYVLESPESSVLVWQLTPEEAASIGWPPAEEEPVTEQDALRAALRGLEAAAVGHNPEHFPVCGACGRYDEKHEDDCPVAGALRLVRLVLEE